MTFEHNDKFLLCVPTHDVDIDHAFINLVDTPTTYSGNENKYLKTTTSGIVFSSAVGGVTDHGELDGLGDDDHTQYVPTNADRGFSSTVSGVLPTEDYHLTTREYVIGVFGGVILPPGASGVAGYSLIQFAYDEDLDISGTNSTAFQEKLRLTVSGVPIGNYRIGWTFDWRVSKTNEIINLRIQMDDTDDLFSYTGIPYVDANYWHTNSSFYYYSALVSGSHNIDIDYCSSSTGATAEVRNARLEFWRIQ